MNISLDTNMDKLLSKYFYQKNPGKENFKNHSINTGVNILLYNLLASKPKKREIANTRVIHYRRLLIQHLCLKLEECFTQIELYIDLPQYECICEHLDTKKSRFSIKSVCNLHGYQHLYSGSKIVPVIKDSTKAIDAFIKCVGRVLHQLTTHPYYSKKLGTDMTTPLGEIQNRLGDLNLKFRDIIAHRVKIPNKSPQKNKFNIVAINTKMTSRDRKPPFVFIPEVFDSISDKFFEVIETMNQETPRKTQPVEGSLINLSNNRTTLSIEPRRLLGNSPPFTRRNNTNSSKVAKKKKLKEKDTRKVRKGKKSKNISNLLNF